MALFEVPGWSMPVDSLAASSSSSSRKRKRPAANDDSEKLQSAEVNIERLMKKLESGDKSFEPRSSKKDKKARSERDLEDSKQRGSKGTSTANAGIEVKNKKGKGKGKGNGKAPESGEQAVASRSDNVAANPPTTGKRRPKGKSSVDASTTENIVLASPKTNFEKTSKKKNNPRNEVEASETDAHTTSGTSLTALQSKMRQTLDGARFRWINETLYKSSSKDAERLMRDDPKIFEDYHAGFRHQVTSWPTNPVDHFTEVIASSCAARSVIVDLGCGDAALARHLVPKGYIVLSFDLISTNPFVVAADMCQTLPLPGSEEDEEDDSDRSQVVDVVVCSLSLMSTNWLNSVREARRVLREGGELKIAEVTSRFKDVKSFVSVISSVGFKLTSKDERNSHFTLFDFKKVKQKRLDDEQWKQLLSRESVLQACEYKRR